MVHIKGRPYLDVDIVDIVWISVQYGQQPDALWIKDLILITVDWW